MRESKKDEDTVQGQHEETKFLRQIIIKVNPHGLDAKNGETLSDRMGKVAKVWFECFDILNQEIAPGEEVWKPDIKYMFYPHDHMNILGMKSSERFNVTQSFSIKNSFKATSATSEGARRHWMFNWRKEHLHSLPRKMISRSFSRRE